MIHYGTYRGAVVGLRGAVVGVRGAAVGVRGAAVGNIGIPTYVISRGAVVRQPQKHCLLNLPVYKLPGIGKNIGQPILQSPLKVNACYLFSRSCNQ